MHSSAFNMKSASVTNAKIDEKDITDILPSVSSPPLRSPFSVTTAYSPRRCSTLTLGLVLVVSVISCVTLIFVSSQISELKTSYTVKSLLGTPLLLPHLLHQRTWQQRRPTPSADATIIATALSFATPRGNEKDTEVPLATPRAPLLTAAELLTLQYYARDSMYAEWGSGASTTLAAPLARRAVSIENQKTWCDEMLASADVDFWIKNGVLTYICVNTGPTEAFGTPTADANPEDFSRYLSALDEAAAAAAVMSPLPSFSSGGQPARPPRRKRVSSRWSLSRSPDEGSISTSDGETKETVPSFSTNTFTVILVDGRFRVACALKALWHLDHSRGVLLIHDWTQRKEEYHAPILKRYKLVTVIDKLAVLIPSSPNASDTDAIFEDSAKRERAKLVKQWWFEAAAELHEYSRDPARKRK